MSMGEFYGAVVGFAIFAIGWAVTYGKLTERVNTIKDDVDEVKKDIKELLKRKNS